MKTVLSLVLLACGLGAAIGFYLFPTTPPTMTPPITVSPAAPTSTPAIRLETLRLGVANMTRLYAAYPPARTAEAEINADLALAQKERQQLEDNGDAQAAWQFKNGHQKEIEDNAVRTRYGLFKSLQGRVIVAAQRHELDLVLDSSSQSSNAVPFMLQASGATDLTDEVLRDFKP